MKNFLKKVTLLRIKLRLKIRSKLIDLDLRSIKYIIRISKIAINRGDKELLKKYCVKLKIETDRLANDIQEYRILKSSYQKISLDY